MKITPNTYFYLILALMAGGFLLDTLIELLNLKNLRGDVPEEFRGLYDAEKYKKSLSYQAEGTAFGLFRNTILLLATVVFWFSGGFEWLDERARAVGVGPILTGLIFIALLSVLRFVINLPFSIYDTFVIKEKYGFNRTTPKTYITDHLKATLLAVVIGGPILAAVLYFFDVAGPRAWLYVWLGMTVIQIFLLFIAPAVILPLFNKFEPVAEGELKREIERYAAAQNFKLSGIYQMDSSKRSAKTNAFFTGIGRFRRLVLFDTLIAKHSVQELVSVVAHEVGHFKLAHIPKSIGLAIATSGLMFYFLSFFLENPELFAAFGVSQVSVYGSLVFIGFLFSPIQRLISVFTHALSRRYEFQADAFACATYGRPSAMINALKKLSVDNFSHLTPHPWKVALEYTHPPVIRRIEAIRRSPGTTLA